MFPGGGFIIVVEYRHVTEWDTQQIVDLYIAGLWWKDEYDPKGIAPLIKGSSDFVVAFDPEENRAVGMGRMISDGVSDGYIQDVVVLNHRRGEGIGKIIIEELIKEARKKGITWIGLIAEGDSSGFYDKLGFVDFGGKPMLFRGGGK